MTWNQNQTRAILPSQNKQGDLHEFHKENERLLLEELEKRLTLMRNIRDKSRLMLGVPIPDESKQYLIDFLFEKTKVISKQAEETERAANALDLICSDKTDRILVKTKELLAACREAEIAVRELYETAKDESQDDGD